MGKRTSIKEELKLFKNELSKKIPVQKIIFFGSRARGNPKKYSDVDLIIVSKKFKEKKFHERPVEIYDYWNLDYPVDFLCYTPEEFNKNKKLINIIRQAIKEGIEI